MKLELEWDETKYRVKNIYAPDHTGKFAHDWIVYAEPANGHYLGGQGKGLTPQAALDDMIRQIEERLAIRPQPVYNEAKPAITLDLTFLENL